MKGEDSALEYYSYCAKTLKTYLDVFFDKTMMVNVNPIQTGEGEGRGGTVARSKTVPSMATKVNDFS